MLRSQEKILEMVRNLQFLQDYSHSLVEEFSSQMQHSHPLYRESLKNLLHYLAIRSHDIRSLQRDLGQLGISRLGKAESHVMASLIAIHHNLQRIVGQEPVETEEDVLSFNEGKRLLSQHVFDLLGPEHNGRQVRIMVTLPTEAAYNFDMVKAMLEAGVNCVRINCAHDNPSVWKTM